ncbi:thioredoxin [Candidatus Uhrbacteria bacterium]|nr:thioredoxin [Candidatus Uhrbacteria bacterium]
MNNLTDATFSKEVLESKIPVVVDFWAPWCGPCKVMGPIFEELSKGYPATALKFAKLNVDENSQFPSKFGVMSIPTLIVFKNGKPADQFVGIQDKVQLKKKLDAIIK